ncbi:hypothetical protein R2360_15125 [Mycobacteroides chelonae]|uniref:Uncharacterized protein n=1 Tax=Mycobacteroides chelonae TaxID=1774 RepID=A0AB73U4U4_MYCCH|nr:hypothetical protein [Mycobacteroides chelonae]MEC4840801.1 hypothetical protein [Mycobacteroides chelonae]MEC4843068.1 hypothetical protein [Mycobacteroides chelonae]OLT75038.1 hypothetical protein BKG57_21970 [Mycobacteroides chelonae]QDF71529.1 hypothetical protein FJK96_16120 [Mycobacteroides chelonae]WED92389.1 hypothetical protein PXJ67_02460 [Mycobacteroides chelonae]
MVDWSAVAAFGALGLGAYNFVHGLREPVRARQRDMRREFLRLLHEIALEWLKIGSDIARTRKLPPDHAPRTSAALNEIYNYSRLLTYPTNEDILRLSKDLSGTLNKLRAYDSALGPNAVLSDKHLEEVTHVFLGLNGRIQFAIDAVSEAERGAFRKRPMYPE